MLIDIFIGEHALRYVQAHTLSFPKVEVAGVLIGKRPQQQRDGRYPVCIHSAIAGKHLKSSAVSVQITADTWRQWNQEINDRYPDGTAVIVGWYHSHPNLPIFFFQDDFVVHQACFSSHHHVSLITDPHKPFSSSKFYCWEPNQNSVIDASFPWPEWVGTAW